MEALRSDPAARPTSRALMCCKESPSQVQNAQWSMGDPPRGRPPATQPPQQAGARAACTAGPGHAGRHSIMRPGRARLGQVADDEVGGREAGGRDGLLVAVLAVDDARVRLARLVVHRVPDLRGRQGWSGPRPACPRPPETPWVQVALCLIAHLQPTPPARLSDPISLPMPSKTQPRPVQGCTGAARRAQAPDQSHRRGLHPGSAKTTICCMQPGSEWLSLKGSLALTRSPSQSPQKAAPHKGESEPHRPRTAPTEPPPSRRARPKISLAASTVAEPALPRGRAAPWRPRGRWCPQCARRGR